MAMSISQAQGLLRIAITRLEESTADSDALVDAIESADVASRRLVATVEDVRNTASALSEGGYRLDHVQSVFSQSADVLRVQREQMERMAASVNAQRQQQARLAALIHSLRQAL